MSDGLTACHKCDALCRDRRPGPGQRVRCPRCGAVLRTARRAALDRLLAFSIAILALLTAALLSPFLALDGAGRAHAASILDAAAAIAGERDWPLGVAVALLIAAIPATRALAMCYVLAPIRLGLRPRPFARAAFRLAVELRPWSMAEVFIIAVAVALVKVAGIAHLTLGPAFWLFAALAVVMTLEDAALCRRSIWDMLE